MSIDPEDIDFGKSLTDKDLRIRKLEESINPQDTVTITDSRPDNESGVPSHDHAEFLISSEIQGMIDNMATPLTQTIEGETAVDAGDTGGTALDISSISAQEIFIEITGQTNTGTFTSCTVDLQGAMTDTDASYKSVATLTLSAAGVESHNCDDFGFLYIRHKITAITLVGNADLDVTIGGKV